MFTQCRGCGEIFELDVDELVTANAMVRCSSCGTVFNSLNTLSQYKPQSDSDLILHDSENPPPLLTHEFKESIVPDNSIHTQKVETMENSYVSEELDSVDSLPFSVKPDFVEESDEVIKKKSSPVWFVLILLLFVGLILQVKSGLESGSLQLKKSEIREVLCARIDCYLGLEQSNLNKVALVSRSIRQHPGRDNALIITTGIINSDEKAQVFPALQIKMSNLEGEVIAMRRFLPSEYMDQESLEAGMPSNTLIPITLELQSPGKNAVTFEVGFSPTHGKR